MPIVPPKKESFMQKCCPALFKSNKIPIEIIDDKNKTLENPPEVDLEQQKGETMELQSFEHDSKLERETANLKFDFSQLKGGPAFENMLDDSPAPTNRFK